MPVRKDPSGRRSVQAEVDVPGTPEAVWRAIATSQGISSWFVPTDVEERKGGVVTSHFAPDHSMDAVASITDWDPPRRFVAISDDMGPGAPSVATEWVVEARDGNTCVVRVVHSWFASSDDWDSQFEGHEQGWVAFFRVLRLYLTHFSGQPPAAFQVMGAGGGTSAQAWESFTRRLGIGGVSVGDRVNSQAGAPALAGIVEHAGSREYPELLLRLDRPAPGLAHLFALPMGGAVYLPVRVYLFGADAGEARAREAEWQDWVGTHFPVAAAAAISQEA